MPQNQEIPQVQIGALAFGAFVHQLPEIAKQLKIANKLKAWELKKEYCSSMPALYNGSEEIDKIMKSE